MTDLTNEKQAEPVNLYICECGPLIKDNLDIATLVAVFESHPDLYRVKIHPTLCSEGGQKWLEQDLEADQCQRFVLAGCSPWEHGKTFDQLCRRVGINPLLFTMANIREQCCWVIPERTAATTKAREIIEAAIARCLKQEPLIEKEIEANTDILIVGAGIAGMSAALLFAAADRKVYLVENEPCIGGRVVRFGEVFPNMECAPCMLEPVMDDVLHHPNIEVFSYSEVEQILGYFGNFSVSIRQKARYVDMEGCYGCATCHAACPVSVPNEYECNLSQRKAIFIPFAGALPNTSVIDSKACLRFKGEDCSLCEQICPFGNIRFDDADSLVEKQVGAIVLATGSELAVNETPGSSYVHPSVLTTMALERMLNQDGPTMGEVRLPDGRIPTSIALLYCADEQGQAPVEQCSKVCCMSMAKYARLLDKKVPEATITRIFWDRCTGGKGYREFEHAVSSRISSRDIHLTAGDQVQICPSTSDTASVRLNVTRMGEKQEIAVDLAVLAPPIRGAYHIDYLAAMLRVDLDENAFLVEEHEKLKPVNTRVEGIFSAGGAHAPGDIADAVAQAAATAGRSLSILIPGRKLPLSPLTAYAQPEVCGGCQLCFAACPYKAISINREKKIAEINELLCRGCGTCAALCPSSAIIARHFTNSQIAAEIDTYARVK